MNQLDEARRRVVQAEADALAAAMDGRCLNEASLARIYSHWKGRGFAIVSADRGERTDVQNKRWRQRLKDAIRADGYGFIPVDGFWYETDAETGERRKVSERSFLVPARSLGEAAAPAAPPRPATAVEALRAAVTHWGKIDPNNPQEAVILVDPNGPVEFINPVTGSVSFKLSSFRAGRVSDIYSGLRKRPGTFVFEGWQFTAPPRSQAEAYRRRHEGEEAFYV